MGLILRTTSVPNAGTTVSVKGAELTFAEGDGNFAYLLTNMSGSNISITGSTSISGSAKATNFILSDGTGNTGLYYGHTNKVVLANYTVGGGIDFETNGGAINMVLDSSANLSVVGYVSASGFSGSLAGTASWAINASTASSADNFTVRGTLTAQTIIAQTITSSTEFITGSTKFGSLSSNTHQFTGSVSISSSLSVTSFISASSFTGSLAGTASYATTASYALNVTPAFPYTGSAVITGSLVVTGSIAAKTDLFVHNSTGEARIEIGRSTTGPRAVMFSDYTAGLVYYSASFSNYVYYYDATSNYTEFQTNGSTKMTILSSGNVGIGTTNPASILNTSGSNQGITHDDSTTGRGYIRFRNNGTQLALFGIAGGWEGSSLQDTMIAAETGYNIRLYTNGSSTPKMYISASGNVGIGTTSPSAKLHVSTDETYSTIANFTHTFNNRNFKILADPFGVGIGDDDGFTSQSIYLSTYNSSLVFNTNGSAKMTILSSGNVGINDTNPSYKLDVNGTGRFTGALTGSSATFSSTVTAASVIETSTRTLKDNIQPYTTEAASFNLLQPVSYNWKDTNLPDVGLIAEDVNEIFPEFVAKENGEITGINYSKLSILFINMLKQHQQQIDELKQEINILKNK